MEQATRSQQNTTTTPSTTQPALALVDYHSRIYLAKYHERISISPDGVIRREEEGRVAEGRLSASQIAKLVEMFSDWEKLNEYYRGMVDGPDYEITYNGRTVKFGHPIPSKQLYDIRNELEWLGDSLNRSGE